MDDLTPGKAVLEMVSTFERRLGELKQAGEQGRADLKAEVEAQLTAVRHDVFGSVVYLSQQLVDLRNTVQAEREENQEWRTTERLERKHGRKVNYLVFSGVAVIALLALLKATGVF